MIGVIGSYQSRAQVPPKGELEVTDNLFGFFFVHAVSHPVHKHRNECAQIKIGQKFLIFLRNFQPGGSLPNHAENRFIQVFIEKPFEIGSPKAVEGAGTEVPVVADIGEKESKTVVIIFN